MEPPSPRGNASPGSVAPHGGARLNEAAPAEVHIPVDGVQLAADLSVPPAAAGIVLFAHGSGSSRHSSRNRAVAGQLHAARLGTLLLDLLTPDEEREDELGGRRRFDISLLARRLVAATVWVASNEATRQLRIGYFGGSTGASAALLAAARLGPAIGAVVSRGGRTDLAASALSQVVTPTLLIVGGRDEAVLALNRAALAKLRGERRLEIVAGATHLFEEAGTLRRVGSLAADWFRAHLTPAHDAAGRPATQRP